MLCRRSIGACQLVAEAILLEAPTLRHATIKHQQYRQKCHKVCGWSGHAGVVATGSLFVLFGHLRTFRALTLQLNKISSSTLASYLST